MRQLDLTDVRKRLRAWYDLFSVRHIADGRAWYSAAREFARALADKYNLPMPAVVGVIACLSPQCPWEINKRDAERLIHAHSLGIEIDGLGTYPTQIDKAYAILNADADIRADEYQVSCLVGGKYAPKTRAFYWNILRPDDPRHVTIDRWVLRALLDLDVIRGGNKYAKWYATLEKTIIAYAASVGISPCVFQATLWHCVKEYQNGREFKHVRSADSFRANNGIPF